MIERIEVTAGRGTVIRFGQVVAWVSSEGSSALISFLSQSARNLASSPRAGAQLADHLGQVLSSRDPEPDVAFVVLGPGDDAWVALLHGEVQVWDGAAWTAPSPSRRWTRAQLWPRPSLSVTPAGAQVPSVSPDSLMNLEAGVVPGAGFALVPTRPAGPPAVRPEPAVMAPEPPVPAAVRPDPGPETRAPSPEPAPGGPEPAAGKPETPAPSPEPAPGSEPPAASPGHPRRGEPAVRVDLRSAEVRQRVITYPPLPPGRPSDRSVAGAPVVAGVLCPRGHINRPGMARCVRCGAPVSSGASYGASGTRPALGCLVLDDATVVRLDRGYVVGAEPGQDPAVRAGRATPLTITGPEVAAAHAEIRLEEWDVVVTDRASAAGTHVFEPDATEWKRLRPDEPTLLKPGTHLALGQRVATFLSPWAVG